ncbi:hypothetical protein ACIQ6R_16210 [Streptomyces sp. NPDC096048]|uniref:hypothetical protein n=1 Tax=Streptomyces sp. NPDC096048 TaxID=3366072 RepID=UPI003801AB4E
MSARCTCRHCTSPVATADVLREPEPIALPTEPTPIRVHTEDRPPFDCTLHPDGTLTAVLGGDVRRNALSFDEMRERNWDGARIEFNPEPLAEEPETEPAAVAVQDVLVPASAP